MESAAVQTFYYPATIVTKAHWKLSVVSVLLTLQGCEATWKTVAVSGFFRNIVERDDYTHLVHPFLSQYCHFMQCCEIKVHCMHVTQLWIFRLSLYCGRCQVKGIFVSFQSKLPLTSKFSLQTLRILLEWERSTKGKGKAIRMFWDNDGESVLCPRWRLLLMLKI